MAIKPGFFSDLPLCGVLAIAIRCAHRVLPLAFDTPIHSSLARAINSASLTAIARPSRTRVAVGIGDYGEVGKDRKAILDCIATVHDSLIECDFHVLSYLTALRDSGVAADNLADATHDADAVAEDREKAKGTADYYSSLSADATMQAVYAKEKAIEAAEHVLANTRTLVYESANPDSHADLESLGNQYVSYFISAVESDITTISRFGKYDNLAISPSALGEMWPSGIPDWGDDSLEIDSITEVSPPILTIVWDPELVSEDEYAEIVAAIGDIVRSEGGVGLQRLRTEGYGIVCNVEVQS